MKNTRKNLAAKSIEYATQHQSNRKAKRTGNNNKTNRNRGLSKRKEKTPQEKISQQALQYDENRVQRQIKGIDYFCPLQDLHYLCHNNQQYYYEEIFSISIINIMYGCQRTG